MDLIIDRNEWLRGEGGIKSFLLRESDGKRCCVGIYARALGVPDNQILNCPWPRQGSSSVESVWRADEADWLIPGVDQLYSLGGINDAYIDETDREGQIAAIFAEHGVNVSFIN